MIGAALKKKIIVSLRNQGFQIEKGVVLPPSELSKDIIRDLHGTAVKHKREVAKKVGTLFKKELELLTYIANGTEVVPENIRPRIVAVERKTLSEHLFRYACLHWSIPVSSGYGRRLRFLVFDESNNKLMGLMGLGDPVFSLGARDRWIGWSAVKKKQNLNHVLDAFVLGAIPPYSNLLCGKLIAMLVASNEVSEAFRKKYSGSHSLIENKSLDGRLAAITTTSALGRSSIYNRLSFHKRPLYYRVGFTRGSGEFQFTNGLYAGISKFSGQHCEPTGKKEKWGTGFRNRREVVKKCLMKIGISQDWLYHGIEREIFVIPLAKNSREFLRGEHKRLQWFGQSAADIFSFFRERWLLPRSQRDSSYKDFRNNEWQIWDHPVKSPTK
jgi:hypothetical protein